MIAVVTTAAALLIAIWAAANAVQAGVRLITDTKLFDLARRMPSGKVRDAMRRAAAGATIGSAGSVAGWCLLIFSCGWISAFITWGPA